MLIGDWGVLYVTLMNGCCGLARSQGDRWGMSQRQRFVDDVYNGVSIVGCEIWRVTVGLSSHYGTFKY